MSDSARQPTITEYAFQAFQQEGEGEQSKEATRDELAGRMVTLALDALRVGCRPELSGLCRDAGARMAWVEASRRLEHERAQRLALAFTAPGVMLEDAQRDATGADAQREAIEQAIAVSDRRLDAWRRR